MRLSESVFFIFFLSAAIGLTGCQQEGSAEKAGQKIDQAAEKAGKKLEETKASLGAAADKTGGYIDDSAITAKINAEILSDPLLKASQINVTTTGGTVKVSGVVDSQQSVDRAMEIVHSNQNVKAVENNLVVKR
ncbi:BON domain-containing protein [Candidatus Methylospira mobilis]|uniref:BON domain-containing protein n=2 Tax=Candidatus Methylospira mobilis TaxID=1808979 RepID=A0A5Q0BPJ6_9GAMM|nr:BON domain-containing protein [Candidatus Methylospira mobilis]